MQHPIKLFFSYAHEDEPLIDDIRRQLIPFQRNGLIAEWYDRMIVPGSEWHGQIDSHLGNSDIVLLFISPHFFASDYCCEAEMCEALRRHRANSVRVIPIILRPCAWENAPFADLQALPTDGHAVTTWEDRDKACLDVANGVMRAVMELRGEAPIERALRQPSGDELRILQVHVHRAFFKDRAQECYFINLTNLSPQRVLEVTHVWYEDETAHIPIAQPTRCLPVRLELDQTWETWIELSRLPLNHRADAISRFKVRISTGTVFCSSLNPSVPPIGSVPGGPII